MGLTDHRFRMMNESFQTDADMTDLDDTTGLIVEEKPEQGLELHVGSNVFRTTNGVIKLQGKEQIVLEVQHEPPALLLTMDFYDEQGQRTGVATRYAAFAVGWQHWFSPQMQIRPEVGYYREIGHSQATDRSARLARLTAKLS